MLNFEIRKILVKPVNKIILLVLATVLLVGSFLTLRDVTLSLIHICMYIPFDNM